MFPFFFALKEKKNIEKSKFKNNKNILYFSSTDFQKTYLNRTEYSINYAPSYSLNSMFLFAVSHRSHFFSFFKLFQPKTRQRGSHFLT